MSFSKIVAVVLLLLSATVLPTHAQDIDTFVIVPDAPSGALVAGCYRADRNLFGPYRLTMCLLERRGTYSIRGGGIRCDGRLTWSASGRNVFVNIDRQSCNRGVAWEAATVECRGQSTVRGILDQIFRGNSRVIVPDLPQINVLACTYFPSVRGERPAAFNARRQR
jgi:hypothetical protein